jgi:alpha-D-ribose 1-methylphosphonate 5-triphosphate synthase subunit PhnH
MSVNGTIAPAPGFAQPVSDSQASFRALLDAMAQPGRVVDLGTARQFVGIPGLSPAAAAVALTLCDLETPVWLASSCQAAGAWLRFHCGAPLVEPAAARFGFATSAAPLPPLESFDLGTVEYPDRSTTLVIDVAALGSGHPLILSGPGISGTTALRLDGLAAEFWSARAALDELFPRGVDLILTCGSHAAALPRTTQVEA